MTETVFLTKFDLVCKIGQGQPRVIINIYTNFEKLKSSILPAKFQGLGLLEILPAIYGLGGHLGHVTWIIYTLSFSLSMKFGFDWSSGFREIFKMVDDNDGCQSMGKL